MTEEGIRALLLNKCPFKAGDQITYEHLRHRIIGQDPIRRATVEWIVVEKTYQDYEFANGVCFREVTELGIRVLLSDGLDEMLSNIRIHEVNPG